MENHRPHLCSRRHHPERAERVVKQPFVDILIKGTYEKVRAHVELLLIRGGLRYDRPEKVRSFSQAPCQGWGDLSRTLLTLIGFPHNLI